MSAKQANQKWKTPRTNADGKPALDPGGPCVHCPPIDEAMVGRHLDTIAELLRHASDDATRTALASMAAHAKPLCTICGGHGFARVCPDCDGHGVTDKMLIQDVVGEHYDEEVEVEVAPSVHDANSRVLRPAKVEKRTVRKLREVTRDAWVNGPACPTCKGNGIVGVPAEVRGG